MDGVPRSLSVDGLASLCMERGFDVIGIDGRTGGGKTTLAARLSELIGAEVLHTDDFYLPFELRTAERMSVAGGHIDRERLLSEAIIPLMEGREAVYAPFDCARGRLGEPVHIKAARALIVEGSYSLHPLMGDIYALRIFCDISPALQRERLLRREGAHFSAFETRWIPLEEAYFKACSVFESCDIIARPVTERR